MSSLILGFFKKTFARIPFSPPSCIGRAETSDRRPCGRRQRGGMGGTITPSRSKKRHLVYNLYWQKAKKEEAPKHFLLPTCGIVLVDETKHETGWQG